MAGIRRIRGARAAWLALIGLVLGAGAGARGAAAQQGRSAQGGGSGGAPGMGAVRLVLPPELDSAMARGTRTRAGAPGPRYWQNSADYDISVRVTPADSLLSGQEHVVYHNNSPNPLRRIGFRVYQNLMGHSAGREQPTPAETDGMVVEEVRADGRAVPLMSPQAEAEFLTTGRRDSTLVTIYGTLMSVPLSAPLPPGGSVAFDIRWHFTIPGAWAPRMGMQDRTTGQIAQWYPQVNVYDDLNGWDQQQYTGTGEFYLDYGHFRYSVTLPAGFIVGGTGVLQNAEQVLTPAAQAVLRRAAGTSDVVHVVAQSDFGPGKATKGSAGSTLTWTFAADSVRDVAFSFGDHYQWDATSAVVDSASKRRALVNVFYRPGAPLFDEVWKMAQYALETHSARMVPYPYPQLTETEGGQGGMEYPMTVFVQAIPGLYREDMVSAHEIGHEWFPMLVGSNETRYGWLDEGLNTFDTYFATDAYIPDSVGLGMREDQGEYVGYARASDEPLVMMAPANAFGVVPNSGYGIEAYAKPGTVLWALRAVLGNDLFYRAYQEYIHRWAYKHPTPFDFFHTFDEVAGQDLDPFWFQWFFTNQRLDQAITSVSQTGNRVSVTVQNVGQVMMPVDVTARTADGKTVTWREPMSTWFDGRTSLTTTHDAPGPVTEVTLDAQQNYPDMDRGNNVWRRTVTP